MQQWLADARGRPWRGARRGLGVCGGVCRGAAGLRGPSGLRGASVGGGLCSVWVTRPRARCRRAHRRRCGPGLAASGGLFSVAHICVPMSVCIRSAGGVVGAQERVFGTDFCRMG